MRIINIIYDTRHRETKSLFCLFQSSAMPSAVSPGGGAIVVTSTGATPFATPTSVGSGHAPPRQPFPQAQYGPPPGGAMIPTAAATPSPSSHGPSPTPSSGSGGGGIGSQPPGYANRSKYGRLRPNTRQPLTTPPTSPAKNRGKGNFFFSLLRYT